MPTIAATVASVQALPAPVMFLDTCVLLDIIRAPLRNAASAVEAASQLLTGTQHAPPSVYLVIGCPTPREWNDHVDQVVTDCTTAVNSVNAVSEAWGFLGVGGIPPLPVAAMQLPNRLRGLSRDLLNASILLDKDADSLDRAIDRIINVLRPMRKEGKSAKDAVIVEHAIGLASALRVAGIVQTCVFVSSNTNDFAKSKITTLHPDLAGAFGAPTNLDYAASITAAVSLLQAGGWVP